MTLRMLLSLVLGFTAALSASISFAQEKRSEFSARYKGGVPAETAIRRGTPVNVLISCIELDLEKLRRVGIHWDLPEPSDDNEGPEANELFQFVRALLGSSNYGSGSQHYGQLTELQLSLTAGQAGSIENKSMKVAITPKFAENGDIKLELALEDYHPSWLKEPFDLNKTVVVRPGEAAYLGQPKTKAPDAEDVADSADNDKDPKTVTLIFAFADTKSISMQQMLAAVPVPPFYGHPYPSTYPQPVMPLPRTVVPSPAVPGTTIPPVAIPTMPPRDSRGPVIPPQGVPAY